MKFGIKVGLKGHPYEDLASTHPDFCEIWFHVNKMSQYDNLFAYIKKININCGLHLWGATSTDTLINLAHPDKENYQQSLKLVKQTIDAAYKHRCRYVNIHPGSCRLSRVNFKSDVIEFKPYGQQISQGLAKSIFYKSISEVANYALERQVEFYIESVPKYAYAVDKFGKLDRNIFVDFGDLSIDIAKCVLDIDNVYFTNDFGHTLGGVVKSKRSELINYLFNISEKLLAKTKLLHVSYIVPPYNGTDYHGSLYDPELSADTAVPNKLEMIKFLQIYKNQDVWALAEPISDHVGNFQTLKKLASINT